MKNIGKALALVLVVAMLALALVSCKTFSGTYKSDAGTTLTFKSNGTVLIKQDLLIAETKEVEAKYSVKDGKITITYGDDSKEDASLSGEHSFEKGSDYIKIDGVTFTKQK